MNIAIAGYGQEGNANFNYWNTPENSLTIIDEREAIDNLPAGAAAQLGTGVFSHLEDFDMVIRTAGVAPRKLSSARKVWSATNEFFAQCPAPIIGVTGTKGKGTTCSLIASILRAAGKNVHLVGNIGVPSLAELPKITSDDIVVFELSSFQLWDIEKSPSVAVVLKIEPDHLDIHANFDEYVNAKSNIRRYQTDDDACFYHPTNPVSKKIADLHNGAKRYAAEGGGAVYVSGGSFKQDDEIICSVDVLQIPGEHNIENACAAISVARLFVSDNHAIGQGIRGFSGLPHRLKFVAEVEGVKYYDDSIATTPGSAIAAINSFDATIVLILGGHDKGADYHELMQECRNQQVSVISIGENHQRIAELCAEYGVEYGVEPGDMRAIVRRASMEANKGSIVILSPAAASFDMFTSYNDRGDQFIAAVNAL